MTTWAIIVVDLSINGRKMQANVEFAGLVLCWLSLIFDLRVILNIKKDPYDQNPRDHDSGGINWLFMTRFNLLMWIEALTKGIYATGLIGRSYQEGQDINVTIDITANHFGYFEFKLCKNDEFMKKVTQECFDENLLVIKNNNEELTITNGLNQEENKFKYFLPNKNTKSFMSTPNCQWGLNASIVCYNGDITLVIITVDHKMERHVWDVLNSKKNL